MDFLTNATLAIQLMWVGTLVCSVWFVLRCAGYLLDRRELFGENVWVKPLRFSSSLAMHYATFAITLALAFTVLWAALSVASYRLAVRAVPISRMWGLDRF